MNAQINKTNSEFWLHDDNIDLRDHLQTINRYKWRVLLLALTVAMLTALIVSAMTPRYLATATLMIQAEQTKVLSIDQIYGLDSSRSEYFLTQFEILKSREIAERVVTRLDLVNHPEFDPDQQHSKSFDFNLRDWLTFLPPPVEVDEAERQRLKAHSVVDAFMERLTISPIRKTQLVKITFEAESPELAAQVANTVAEVYVESHLEAKLEFTQRATTWLNQRLEVLRQKLEASEAELQTFQESEGLVDVEGVRGLASQELNEITAQLLETRRNLNQAKTIYELVQSRGKDVVALGNLPEVLNHNVIQDVKKAEVDAARKVSELSRRYGPKHPKMIAARGELQSVRDNLRREINHLVAGIENDYRTAQANERELVQALKTAKGDFQKVSRKEGRYNELKREVDINKQLYNAFLTRFKETSEISDFQAANARLVDSAKTPRTAAKPQKRLIIMLAFIVTVALGIILAFLMETLHDTIRTPDDVENKLGQRMIGLLPWVKKGRNKNLDLRVFFDRGQHAFAEAVRTLRTSVVLSYIDKPAKVISVTSSVPSEGKTTVAENLAFALVQMESVLLIDADMRRPSVGKHFGLPRYQPGLSNLIAGSDKLEDCIFRDEESGLDVMPAGVIPPNPQELLASDRFVKVLETLVSKYDRIVIDNAPTQAVSDALLIARKADCVLYVVKSDSTKQRLINNGIGRLLQIGARVDGVILNQVDATKGVKHGQYYYGYYDQYGYGAENTGMALGTEDEIKTNHRVVQRESA